MGLKMAHHSSKSKCDGSFHVKSNHAVVNCGVLNFLSIKLTFTVEYGEHMGMLAAILHVSSVICYAQKPIFCVAFSLSARHVISQKNLVIIMSMREENWVNPLFRALHRNIIVQSFYAC